MDQLLGISSNVVMGSVALIVIGLGVLIAFGLRRMKMMAVMMSDHQNFNKFFTAVLNADPRASMWIWKDGRIEADSSFNDVINISKNAHDLSDLEGIFPPEIMSIMKDQSLPHGGQLLPISLLGDTPLNLMVEITPIDHEAGDWPNKILRVKVVSDEKLFIKKLENKARGLDQYFAQSAVAMENIPFPVWLRDLDGKLIQVNQTYTHYVGQKHVTDVLEKNIDLFEPSKRLSFKDQTQKIIEMGKSKRERLYTIVNGQRRAFSVTYVPLEPLNAVMSVAIDVTGEEEALSELSRVLESQTETLNRLQSPVAIFGPDKALRFWNQAFQKLTGITEEKLGGQIDHGELLDEMRATRRLPEQADFQGWKTEVLKHYTALLEPLEEMWHMPEGTSFRVLTQPHPLGGVLLLFEDMTDRLALEGSYNTLIAVQRESLEHLHEAIAVFGLDGKLQLFNSSLNEVWGPDFAPVEGMHLSDCISCVRLIAKADPDQKSFDDNLGGWIAKRRSRDGRWQRKDGRVIDYALVPLPDGAMLLSQIDVTDSFGIEKALRERSQALEEADRLKSEFVANISYELRTPLNTIIGFGEMLETGIYGSMNAKQFESIGDILIAANTLKNMISDVLDLAVIEAGEMELEIDTIDVQSAASEVSVITAETLIREQTELVMDTSQKVRPLQADVRRFKQALINMLMTAARVDRSSIGIALKFSETEDYLNICVTAMGSELEGDALHDLITAFANGRAVSVGGSSSFDLALVRNIAKLHHGDVELRAEHDNSLSIIMKLPWVQPSSDK